MNRKFLPLLFLVCNAALADWPCRPDSTIPVAVAAGNQWNVRLASDGQSGAILVWQDRRFGSMDKLFAQRISASGNPQWQPNGVALSGTGGYQYYPQIIPDGAGGAIVAWQDNRSGLDYDIYAQRLDANGNALWGANGAVVCSDSGHQYNPQLVTDGAGGAIITWQDRRSGSFDIYAQHIAANGSAAWTSGGLRVCGASSDQIEPKISPDGSGGAFIGWLDYRLGTGSTDVYCQRISQNGSPIFPADGIPVCAAPNVQWNLQMASDSHSGTILAWQDRRGGSSDNIFAQRVDQSGNAIWQIDGISVAASLGFQAYPQISADGGGGVVIAWQDNRTGTDYDIYAQRLDPGGNLLWSSSGKAVCSSLGHQYNPQLTAQGGSVFITWQDKRGPDFDIYAQRLDLSGNTFWTGNGIQVASLLLDQVNPQLASDGGEGAIVAWSDYHLNSGSTDVYSHRIGANGLPAGGCYRTFVQDSLALKSVRFKKSRGAIIARPNVGNVRDSIFSRGVFPDGLFLGVERRDSAKTYGWIFFGGSVYVRRALPQWVTARPLARLLDKDFVGKLRNPTVNRYNNRLVGELLTLKMNIAASDAGLTPARFGELVYKDNSEFAVQINNRSLRNLIGSVDSLLTYYRSYSNINYSYLATALAAINASFDGRFDTVSTAPLKVTPTKALFSIPGLVPGVTAPPALPSFQPLPPSPDIPTVFALSQNYPNPFNPLTTIEFVLKDPAVVTLTVYNTLGQEVRVLLDHVLTDDGQQVVDFDATNLSSGVYFYRLSAEPVSGDKPLTQVRKMVLLK